jgi:hypothetical protein
VRNVSIRLLAPARTISTPATAAAIAGVACCIAEGFESMERWSPPVEPARIGGNAEPLREERTSG